MRWIFLVAKYKRKIRRKNPPENPPAENKKSAGARPPQNPPARPKIHRKTYQQIRLSTSKYTPGFSIEKDWSWRRLQSMDSGTLFGCLLDMVQAPMLKFICKPSAAAGGMDNVCCAPFQTTLSVKSVRFEKRPKNNKKTSATRLCYLWQPKVSFAGAHYVQTACTEMPGSSRPAF